MKTFRIILLLTVVFGIWQTANSQFKVDAEIRPRSEFRDGSKQLLDEDKSPAFVTSQRTRLNIGYNFEQVETHISIQDVRVWGDYPYKTDGASFHVNEAWAGYSFTDSLQLRLGRQTLSYDDNRLLSPRNWNNVGASHDIAILKVKTKLLNIDAAFAYNNDGEKNFESNYSVNYYKYLSFLWLNKDFNDNLSVSLMNIADGFQRGNSSTAINSRVTSGTYLNYSSGNLGLKTSFYYQYGVSQAGKDISAYAFSIQPSFKLSSSIKFIAGIDYFSGNDTTTSNTERAFSKLYGHGHGYYGYMDYFTEIEKHTKGAGLQDIYFRVQHSLNKKTTTELTLHHFSIANELVDEISEPGTTKLADNFLGTELDLMIKHKLSNKAEFRCGYSTMLANKTMEILKGGDSSKYQQWAWVMFIFKPTLFEQ